MKKKRTNKRKNRKWICVCVYFGNKIESSLIFFFEIESKKKKLSERKMAILSIILYTHTHTQREKKVALLLAVVVIVVIMVLVFSLFVIMCVYSVDTQNFCFFYFWIDSLVGCIFSTD